MTPSRPARSPLGRSLAALWSPPPGATPPPAVWDVIIVGTGYGGSAAAATLAHTWVDDPDSANGRRRARIGILERGSAHTPGDFPSTMAELPAHVRLGRTDTGEVRGAEEGLFDLRLGPDVVALVANGVGGGSLINAGVLLEPEADELRRIDFRHWVKRLQRSGAFRQARRVLGGDVPTQSGPEAVASNTIELHPALRTQSLRKARALRSLAAPGESVSSVPLSVAMTPQVTAAGVALAGCTLCGDCMTGCNAGAKISLDTTLLHRAVAAGAELYTGASVSRIERDPDASGWTVEIMHTRRDLQAREPGPLRVRTRRLVLAAGTLGSTEILLRSRSVHLALSPRLGERFSCNGDNLAAVHRMAEATDGCADETTPLDGRRVGPTITSALSIQGGLRPFLLQEFAVPGPMGWLFGEAVTTAHTLQQLTAGDESPHGNEGPDRVDPAAVDPDAMARTLLVGLIGHDDAEGVLALPPGPALGTLRIHWPQARQAAVLDDAMQAVQARVDDRRRARAGSPLARAAPAVPTATSATSGRATACASAADKDGPHLLPNPLWRALPDAVAPLLGAARGPVLTVHPLGGCAMGLNRDEGVVDRFGRVFDGAAADARGVHDGLVVLDGAIIPESLGANPSLTITALALRAARHLRRQWGLKTRLATPASGSPDPITPDRAASSSAAPSPTAPAHPRDTREAAPPAPTGPPAHRVAVLERLVGPVWVQAGAGPPRRWMMELTLEFEPASLGALTVPLRRCLTVDTTSSHSRIRLYDAQDWAERGLRGLDEGPRRAHAAFEAPVSGTLTLGHREATRASGRRWRALRVWLRHRGARDLWQQAEQIVRAGWRRLHLAERRATQAEQAHAQGWGAAARDAWRLASRAGEVRRFDYRLRVGPANIDTARLALGDDGRRGPWFEGSTLIGHKRLTYAAPGAAANPWRQLTEVTLTSWPGATSPRRSHRRTHPSGGPAVPLPVTAGLDPPDGVLRLDPRFLAQREVPLLRSVQGRNQVQALTELASLALMGLRLMAHLHLWTFRAPDAPAPASPVRLPQAIDGLPPPQITELAVDPEARAPDGGPVVVRLTRYPPRSGCGPRRPALVMVHGYSVSGNTFTHPSLRPSAAAHFHGQGRDVWVVDLRTSAGLATANQPWTLEQVALIDLPAALCHVRQVTGGPVDVLAHCIGCVMLSMALLSRPAELQARAQALERPLGLNEAQRTTLDVFNGRGPTHATVRRVVLSQKGPVLRYTDANVLRAWVMAFLRRWLPAGLQFRPSAPPSAAESLLDRLLASLPYPEADWAIENPWQPWRRTAWTATRHRMDALYGRDFEAANLRRPTLQAIDDLFGPMHLDTVAQTLHFALHDRITDASGGGEFVTAARLRERWAGLPTLALHGADNGLVDAWTQRLLAAHLGAAGVPIETRTYPGVGHQDLLIGRDARRVFDDIEAFLAREPVEVGAEPSMARPSGAEDPHRRPGPQDAAVSARGPAVVLRAPGLGPRVDVTGGHSVRVAGMAALHHGPATWVLLPVHGTPATGLRLAEQAPVGRSAAAQPARIWQFVEADVLLGATGDAPPDGWLAALAYPAEDAGEFVLDGRWPDLSGGPGMMESPPVGPPPRPGAPVDDAALRRAAQAWLDAQRDTGALALWSVFVPRQALQRIGARLSDRPGDGAPPVRIAVASCQYPHGLLDREPAQASLQRMAQRARTGDIDLALFLGDQIYADATAGLVDPLRRDERYEQPHERAQSAPGMRQVLAALPTVMALDDHELVDNWEPPPRGGGSDTALWALREASLRDGQWAYWAYERLRPKPRHTGMPRSADKIFRFGGVPIFLADTRLGRDSRSLSDGQARRAHILSARTWWHLEAWLLRHRHTLKFVATPSLLLPRRREVAQDPAAACRSDAWDGFPASLERLLDFIARHHIERTVFLSGDEHHAMACEVSVQAPPHRGQPRGPAVRLLSLHSSALYAPFPFANGRAAHFSDAAFVTRRGTQVTLRTTNAPPGDGFAIVHAELLPAAGLHVEWVRADGAGAVVNLPWGPEPTA